MEPERAVQHPDRKMNRTELEDNLRSKFNEKVVNHIEGSIQQKLKNNMEGQFYSYKSREKAKEGIT